MGCSQFEICKGETVNNWMQRRLFTCPRCGAQLVHDKMYLHDLFLCELRQNVKKAKDLAPPLGPCRVAASGRAGAGGV